MRLSASDANLWAVFFMIRLCEFLSGILELFSLGLSCVSSHPSLSSIKMWVSPFLERISLIAKLTNSLVL